MLHVLWIDEPFADIVGKGVMYFEHEKSARSEIKGRKVEGGMTVFPRDGGCLGRGCPGRRASTFVRWQRGFNVLQLLCFPAPAPALL